MSVLGQELLIPLSLQRLVMGKLSRLGFARLVSPKGGNLLLLGRPPRSAAFINVVQTRQPGPPKWGALDLTTPWGRPLELLF